MTLLRPRRRITIAGPNSKGLIMNKAISIIIESSFNMLSDTAEVVIPRRLKIDGETYTIGDSNDLFQVGDKIRIEMGYDATNLEQNLVTRFEGFIRQIIPGDNIVIHCKDEMYFMEQVNKQTQYLTPITIVDLVKDMTDAVKTQFSGKGFTYTFDRNNIGSNKSVSWVSGDPFAIVCLDSKISGYRLKRNPNIAQCLDGLRKNFGFRSWFRDHVLYVGLLWYSDIPAITPVTHTFRFQYNIIDNGENLKYRRSDDYKMGVKVISVNMDDNSRYTGFVGEEGGDLKTIHRMHRSTDSESDVKSNMEKMGNVELRQRNYTGFQGYFRTFGEPVVKHGDHVKLIDKRHPLDREGTYIVEKVKTMDGVRGQWQDIWLNSRVDVDDHAEKTMSYE